MAQPIHTLLAALEKERLLEIEKLASWDAASALATEALQRLSVVQIALTAIREEVSAHEPRLGGGSEQPLA